MKTIMVAYRVGDLGLSLAFYTALGYVEVGRVEAGLQPEPVQFPGGSGGPKTSWLTDPDGYRIELVE